MARFYTDENGPQILKDRLRDEAARSNVPPPKEVRRSDWRPGPEITAAVVRIGEGGRGFVVEGEYGPRVITAAHCLPELPPAHGGRHPEEHHFRLLGKLGEAPDCVVDCLFVDPMADLAVLAQPDHADLADDEEAYEALVEEVTPLVIGDVDGKVEAWMLSLAGIWFSCVVERCGPALWISDIAQPIESGMSGSPIMVDGKAVGVACMSAANPDHAPHGPNPALTQCLPRWLSTGTFPSHGS